MCVERSELSTTSPAQKKSGLHTENLILFLNSVLNVLLIEVGDSFALVYIKHERILFQFVFFFVLNRNF